MDRGLGLNSVPAPEPVCVNPIGFLGADWWGSDARATGAELRRRGCLLIERHYEDYFPTRWRSLILRGLRSAMRPLICRDYNSAVRELLHVRALEFLLVFKGMLLDAATLRLFRDRGIPCYCIYPDVSFLDHGGNIWQCLPLYDCVFTTKSYHKQDTSLRSQLQDLQLVPHGYDPEVHRRLSLSSAAAAAYSCDVSFVGVWSPSKEAHLQALIDRLPSIDLRIWGPSWQNARMAVRRYWQGRGAWGDEIAAIYQASKINLGLLSEAGTGTSSGDLTTARTWQIPGSGGFLLHQKTAELCEAFEAESEVGVFSGPAELPSRVDWWLQHPLERKAAADRGWERAVNHQYTYARAVAAVLDYHLKRKTVA
jgi:spore maturation protein CgeB